MARTLSMFNGAACQDLHLDDRGNIAVVSDLEDVRQRTIERLQYFFRQWFLNTEGGVPYLQELLTRPISAGLAASLLTDEISAVEGVTAVRDVTAVIDPDERRLTYSAIVSTPYGDTEVSNG